MQAAIALTLAGLIVLFCILLYAGPVNVWLWIAAKALAEAKRSQVRQQAQELALRNLIAEEK